MTGAFWVCVGFWLCVGVVFGPRVWVYVIRFWWVLRFLCAPDDGGRPNCTATTALKAGSRNCANSGPAANNRRHSRQLMRSLTWRHHADCYPGFQPPSITQIHQDSLTLNRRKKSCGDDVPAPGGIDRRAERRGMRYRRPAAGRVEGGGAALQGLILLDHEPEFKDWKPAAG